MSDLSEKSVSPAVDFVSECVKLAEKYGVRGYMIAATSVNPTDVMQVQRRFGLGSPRHPGKIATSDAALIVYDLVKWAGQHPDVLNAVRALGASGGEDIFEGAARA